MPLVPPVIETLLSAEIQTEMIKAFGNVMDPATGASSHKKMADAIAAAVTKVIIGQILSNAQVAPGIASTPAATVGPGKII